jgi:hypothetical protein
MPTASQREDVVMALLRILGIFLIYVAAVAGSNFGSKWAIPFIVVTLLIFLSGPIIEELGDPVDRKRRAIFMAASAFCWSVFTLTIYHCYPYAFETKPTRGGVIFAVLTFVFGPAAFVLWKHRKREPNKTVAQ